MMVVALMYQHNKSAVTATPALTVSEPTLVPGYFVTQTAVAFVVRNHTDQRIETVFVRCAVYSGERMLDVGIAGILAIEPHAEVHDKTEPVIIPAGVKPDHAKCNVQK